MNIQELKKHLAELTKKELINEISFLFKMNSFSKDYYSSMESMFENALKFIQKHNLGKNFNTRCKKIVADTDGIGWGFHDRLGYLYDFYFPQKSGAGSN
jgi:hypothetical protein